MKKQLNTLLVCLLAPSLLFANAHEKDKFTKQKTIAKAYLVNADAGIDIANSYGNIFVTTWDSDKVDINIVIKVSGDNEDAVEKRLNAIDVELTPLKHLVSAKTVIGNAGKSNSIEINYTIKIPKKGSVKLNNKYGSIMTSDLAARTDIVCKYGKVTMGRLTGNSNQITLDYCDGSVIEHAKNADITAKYSKLAMNSFGNLTLKSNYTEVAADSGDNVKYDSKYGKLAFGKLKNLDGDGDYLEIAVNEISGNLDLKTRYSKIAISNMTANAGNIKINSGYTDVNIGYNPNYAFNYDVEVKYANFNYEGFESESKQENTGVKSGVKSYKGYYKKSGNNTVTIHSDYGNVNLSKN